MTLEQVIEAMKQRAERTLSLPFIGLVGITCHEHARDVLALAEVVTVVRAEIGPSGIKSGICERIRTALAVLKSRETTP